MLSCWSRLWGWPDPALGLGALSKVGKCQRWGCSHLWECRKTAKNTSLCVTNCYQVQQILAECTMQTLTVSRTSASLSLWNSDESSTWSPMWFLIVGECHILIKWRNEKNQLPSWKETLLTNLVLTGGAGRCWQLHGITIIKKGKKRKLSSKQRAVGILQWGKVNSSLTSQLAPWGQRLKMKL